MQFHQYDAMNIVKEPLIYLLNSFDHDINFLSSVLMGSALWEASAAVT